MEFIFKLYTLKCIDVFKTTCWSLDLCCPGHDGRSLVPRNLRGPRDGEWGFPPAHSDPGSAKSAGDHCCPPVESSDAAQGRDRVRACVYHFQPSLCISDTLLYVQFWPIRRCCHQGKYPENSFIYLLYKQFCHPAQNLKCVWCFCDWVKCFFFSKWHEWCTRWIPCCHK